MTQQAEIHDLQPVFYKLPPEHIVLFKSIIESYEELGEIRTLNPKTGVVVVLALPSTVDTVRAAAREAAGELGLREIPRPDSLEGDWLLSNERR